MRLLTSDKQQLRAVLLNGILDDREKELNSKFKIEERMRYKVDSHLRRDHKLVRNLARAKTVQNEEKERVLDRVSHTGKL